MTSSPFHQITILPINHFTKSPFQQITISSSHYFTKSPNHYFTTSSFHQSTISPNHPFTKSLFHQTTISQNRRITISPLHHFTKSPFHHLTKSPLNHCFIKSLFHKITESLLISQSHIQNWEFVNPRFTNSQFQIMFLIFFLITGNYEISKDKDVDKCGGKPFDRRIHSRTVLRPTKTDIGPFFLSK